MDRKPIVPAPPPWKLRGTAYIVTFYNEAGNLPDHAYSPLERDSPYASLESGKHVGGISQFHIIRYTESPVGPYDELIIIPGFFEYDTEEAGKRRTKKASRITRIYVSQKYTCWNGRKNWNIPKHLARFEFDDRPDGSTHVKVYPHDTDGDATEAQSSAKPLFQSTFKPMRWVPSIPLSLSWVQYLGLDLSLVHPPLPEGRGSQGELPGTDRWCKITPYETTKRATLGWADMSQKDERGIVTSSVEPENFWPKLRRWHVALRLENAEIDFGEGTHWGHLKTKL